MKTDEIRARFLSFFNARNHQIIKSDSLLPQNDPTLLFTGAGMNQFKEYFLGVKNDFTRAASCQKCLRTGDLDNVGKTAYHHSFFEMLGNFSFGDYFKKEAIHWAWEFLTRELGIDQSRLYVSVHMSDEESYGIWYHDIRVPENRISRFGDKDNFWPSNAPTDGPNGPCGPCSEIFFDQGYECGCRTDACSPACSCGRFAEIWNLVFTHYERTADGTLVPLPSKNIDTGMGLERIACVMQGKKTNFEIDIFEPLIEAILGEDKKLRSRLHAIRPAVYAIADHVRASTFAITDGAYPSNEGRGYVVRKLVRRSVWHAHMIGIRRTFLYKMIPHITKMFAMVYPELVEQMPYTVQIMQSEEERFLNTLEDGRALLDDLLQKAKREGLTQLKGEDVFKLYDTYGFPDELTRLSAEQAGIGIEQEVFNRLMEEQRVRAKNAAVISDAIFVGSELEKKILRHGKKHFAGYSHLEVSTSVDALFVGDDEVHCIEAGVSGVVLLSATPFYAESGGQVGDRGSITNKQCHVDVVNTKKKDDIIYHEIVVTKGTLRVGDQVMACVDRQRREAVKKNHTATHLLQAALRMVLGAHVRQLGSLVNDEKLRFDFSYPKPLTDAQKEEIEMLVNQKIEEGVTLSVHEMTVDKAKQMGALAFFGDRYGDTVRMVSAGDFSKELCGGTHVENTKHIGQFKIISEGSIASGIRRIEAVVGEKAHQHHAEKKQKEIDENAQKLKKEIKKKEARARMARLTSGDAIDGLVRSGCEVNGVMLIVHESPGLNQAELRELFDAVKTKVKKAVVVFLSPGEQNAALMVALTKDLQDTPYSAHDFVQDINPVIEGSGGGRKEMAFSGSKTIEKVKSALPRIKEIVQNKLITT